MKLSLDWDIPIADDARIGDTSADLKSLVFPCPPIGSSITLSWTDTTEGDIAIMGGNFHDPNLAADDPWNGGGDDDFTDDWEDIRTLFKAYPTAPGGTPDSNIYILGPDVCVDWLYIVFGWAAGNGMIKGRVGGARHKRRLWE